MEGRKPSLPDRKSPLFKRAFTTSLARRFTARGGPSRRRIFAAAPVSRVEKLHKEAVNRRHSLPGWSTGKIHSYKDADTSNGGGQRWQSLPAFCSWNWLDSSDKEGSDSPERLSPEADSTIATGTPERPSGHHVRQKEKGAQSNAATSAAPTPKQSSSKAIGHGRPRKGGASPGPAPGSFTGGGAAAKTTSTMTTPASYLLQSKGKQAMRLSSQKYTIELSSNSESKWEDDCIIMGTAEGPKRQRTDVDASCSSEAEVTRMTLWCSICYQPMKDVCTTLCGHLFCLQCMKEHFRASPYCPYCRRKSAGLRYHRIYMSSADHQPGFVKKR